MSSKYKPGSLGERMKNYEIAYSEILPHKKPCIIRIDGKAAHTFTKGFAKPFSHIFFDSMTYALERLCEEIQGCVFGYTQSDEINLVLTDYQNPNSCGWFDYKVQKICSVAASMATYYFNKEFENQLAMKGITKSSPYFKADGTIKHLFFDARCFSLPHNEIVNYLIWRQQDAIRNSKLSLALAYYSQKEISGYTTDELCDKLAKEKNFNWHNHLYTYQKWGVACIKTEVTVKTENGVAKRAIWQNDFYPPLFTENKDYITDCLPVPPALIYFNT